MIGRGWYKPINFYLNFDLSVVTFGPVSGLYPGQRNVSYFRHKVTLHYRQLAMPRGHQRAAYDEGNC